MDFIYYSDGDRENLLFSVSVSVDILEYDRHIVTSFYVPFQFVKQLGYSGKAEHFIRQMVYNFFQTPY